MKKSSLISDLRKQTVVPLLFLCLSAMIITAVMLYGSVKKETKDGLANLAHALRDICSLQEEGDYSLKNGVMMKGSEVFDPESTIVDNIYYVSKVDATIFFEDTRMLTSLRDLDGDRAVGTKVSPIVKEEVLENGNDYFSDRVSVNGVPYFGYYIPLKNYDQSIIGMVFVGKSRMMVIKAVMKTVILLFVVMGIIMGITLIISWRYSKNIILTLNKTKEFLGQVAQGDVKVKLESALIARTDEIGEMGRFAVMMQKSITELVGTDTLTGLYNRRSCLLFLSNVMREYQQYDTPFTIVIGDIDNFKNINDKYGHAAGDEVLRHLALLFMEHMGRKGLVARWGGEEFLFIYERMGKERTIEYAQEIRIKIEKEIISYGDIVMPITMTFGVAQGEKEELVDSIIKRADECLYRGKRTCKNTVNE